MVWSTWFQVQNQSTMSCQFIFACWIIMIGPLLGWGGGWWLAPSGWWYPSWQDPHINQGCTMLVKLVDNNCIIRHQRCKKATAADWCDENGSGCNFTVLNNGSCGIDGGWCVDVHHQPYAGRQATMHHAQPRIDEGVINTTITNKEDNIEVE